STNRQTNVTDPDFEEGSTAARPEQKHGREPRSHSGNVGSDGGFFHSGIVGAISHASSGRTRKSPPAGAKETALLRDHQIRRPQPSIPRARTGRIGVSR